MSTLSLAHVQLTNRLRAVRRDAFRAAADDLERLRADTDIDLDRAAAILLLRALAQIARQERAINRERLVEYRVNGMSLDGPGVPGRIGPVADGDRAFERLSAQIDRAARAWRDLRIPEPLAAFLAPRMAAERRRYRFTAWAITHPTCAVN